MAGLAEGPAEHQAPQERERVQEREGGKESVTFVECHNKTLSKWICEDGGRESGEDKAEKRAADKRLITQALRPAPSTFFHQAQIKVMGFKAQLVWKY